jgi:two-component system, NarL family, nitrate/nitrite response regulator NarL
MGVQATRAIDVVIAEKNPLLQSSLVKLFSADERFNLTAVTADGERFLETIERIPFDVGVIGWEMPCTDGRGVLQALRGRTDSPRLIIYTGSPNPDVPRQAMTLGAAGFCSKREAPEQLLDTIASVAAGRMVFPFIDVSSLASDPLAGLTPRERELLGALAGGLTNQQMATQLDISLNTVKFHLKNLYDKLGVGNRAQAVAFYLKGRESR